MASSHRTATVAVLTVNGLQVGTASIDCVRAMPGGHEATGCKPRVSASARQTGGAAARAPATVTAAVSVWAPCVCHIIRRVLVKLLLPCVHTCRRPHMLKGLEFRWPVPLLHQSPDLVSDHWAVLNY